MSINNQKQMWEKSWQSQNYISPEETLYSRFTKKAYRTLKRFIDKEDLLILEARCGTGRLCCLLAENFSKAEITGIDFTPGSLEIANKLKQYLDVKNVEFKEGDLFKLDYPDEYFDVVFNSGVLEHFPLDKANNYNDALREMIRVLKPGGKIIIDVPNWYCFAHTLYKRALKKAGKEYVYGYEKSFKHLELIELFKAHGLVDLKLSAYDSAHGIYRLRGYSLLLKWLGDIVYLIDNPLLESLFGFMLLIKGEKPFKKDK